MTPAELLATPIKTFWLMSANVRRIQAEQDIRSLFNHLAGQGGEGMKDHHSRLVEEVGMVMKKPVEVKEALAPDGSKITVEVSVESNADGFSELKDMARQFG
jgi:hypothetical protein